MMKNQTLLQRCFRFGMVCAAAMALTYASPAQAQQSWTWEYKGLFPTMDHPAQLRTNHGLAVDKNGRIWIQPYYATAENNTRAAIWIFNEDGTEADFSPISIFQFEGIADTLSGVGAGLTVDHNGNVLAAQGHKLYRFDANTGEATHRYIGEAMQSATAFAVMSGPSVTEDGDILVSYVFPGTPVELLDENFDLIQTVIDAKPSETFARTSLISRDGKDIYLFPYPRKQVWKYSSEDGVFGEYALADTTLADGMAVESATWDPISGRIFLSAGSNTDVPRHEELERFTWYSLDVTTGEYDKEFTWNETEEYSPEGDPRPRAIAFAEDGMTVYVGAFGSQGKPAVQYYTRTLGTGTNLISETIDTPEGYTLSQNYPNPFNPSTQIKFELADVTNASLKVYDSVGRLVATLVNDMRLSAGSHTFNFDASKLASGVYLYELHTANGVRLTNKMTLIK